VSCAVKFLTVIFTPSDAFDATEAARPSPQLTEAIYGHLMCPMEWQWMRRVSDAAAARKAADVTHDRRYRSVSDAAALARLVLTRQHSVTGGLAPNAAATSDATELSVRHSENSEETFRDFASFSIL
jgi:hypothetical protein